MEPHPLVAENEKLRMVVFGDPGVGKTTLAATFPRPLIVDVDGGLIAVALDGTDALVITPSGYKDLEDLYQWVKQHAGEVESIVVDSVTELQRLLVDQIVDEGKGKTGRGSQSITDFVPEQAEYLANQRQIHRFLYALKQLGKHVIVTAGVRERGVKRCPDVTPGLLTIVNHWSSVTGELLNIDKNGEIRRVLITQPSNTREAKTRFSSLTPYVENPTFTDLWGRIQKQHKERSK